MQGPWILLACCMLALPSIVAVGPDGGNPAGMTKTLGALVAANVVGSPLDGLVPDACETPGPDDFGYTCSFVPFVWLDIAATGSVLALGDDTLSPPVPIGFDFRHYGQTFSDLQVCSNGYVTFTASFDAWCPFTPVALPDASAPPGMLAAYWTDLFPAPGCDCVRYGTFGLAPSRTFVVEFAGVQYFANGAPDGPANTFQIQLHEASQVAEVHYLDAVTDGLHENVAGIQDETATMGLRFRTLGAPGWSEAGRAVRYAPEGEGFARDRVVAGLRDASPVAVAAVEEAAGTLGASLLRVDARLGFAVIEVPPANQAALLRLLPTLPVVAYAEPDGLLQTAFPNDPSYPNQWGPPAIGAPAAWTATRGSQDVKVAVLDTGVRSTHEDLTPVCELGADFTDGDPNDDEADDPSDNVGHGTHVAGTIAAGLDNNVGVAGMADVCLMVVKVAASNSPHHASNLASGIGWALDHEADIISMSLAGASDIETGAALKEAVQRAWGNGTLLVAAAGNNRCEPVSYPAAYPEVIAVGALSSETARAARSSCGREIELVAPGSGILSTCRDSDTAYCSMEGTSRAAAHVAGVAALVWSLEPDLSAAEVRCILRETADDLGAPGHDHEYGFGRVDAAAAVQASASPGCVADARWPPPPAPGACVTPGPDAFGYTCQRITLEFEDIRATGTQVQPNGRMMGPFPLGGTFTFYGTSYTQAYICENGFVAFSAGQVCDHFPDSIPNPMNPSHLAALFWTRLHPESGGMIHYETRAIGNENAFVVQWTDMADHQEPPWNTFQGLFFLTDSRIEVHYLLAATEHFSHTTGIENAGGTTGLAYAPRDADLTGTAVCYIPPGSGTCGLDTDGDGFSDGVDNCPLTPNSSQDDFDEDGLGDACEDSDGDGVFDDTDNCPAVLNLDQADGDGDGIGTACEDCAPTSSPAHWELRASDGATDDLFGDRVALDGDFAVVGAPLDDDQGTNSGAVYVYRRTDGSWIETQKLVPSDGTAYDFFGTGVAIHGDLLVVGSPGNGPLLIDPGAAYVFRRGAAGAWSEEAKLVASDAGSWDFLGSSVSVYAGTVVVGAPWKDHGARGDAGTAYVFRKNAPGGWTETQVLTAPDDDAGDLFGVSLDVHLDNLVVGAQSDDERATDAGAAYAFRVSPAGVWALDAKLLASDGSRMDAFGREVALSGDIVVVSGDWGDTGAAYVFERAGPGAWTQGKLTIDCRGVFQIGWSVDIDGERIVADAYSFPGQMTAEVLFERDPVTLRWQDSKKFFGADSLWDDRFGSSVAIDGSRMIVGAPRHAHAGVRAGAAYVLNSADLDGDSLPDAEEPQHGTDPTKADTDGDGVLDGVEIGGCEDPTDSDTDGDGLSDGTEDANKNGRWDPGETSPCSSDSDGDGVSDAEETNSGCMSPTSADTDGDGIPDGREDASRDGVVDPDETNPCNADTDGDGIPDGTEDADRDGTRDAGETDPRLADTDFDGLSDGTEDADQDGVRDPGETDPLDRDTDGDFYGDGTETACATNPRDPLGHPPNLACPTTLPDEGPL